VRKADNLPPSCADVKKSGGLNLLETCGPVQACNGAVFFIRNLQILPHEYTLFIYYGPIRKKISFVNILTYYNKFSSIGAHLEISTEVRGVS
jgi:hypothetical protein